MNETIPTAAFDEDNEILSPQRKPTAASMKPSRSRLRRGLRRAAAVKETQRPTWEHESARSRINPERGTASAAACR